MSNGVSVINRNSNHIRHMWDMEFCNVLQKRHRHTVGHFTYHKEISTVLAEELGSGKEEEDASTISFELRIISVMALIQFAVFYCLWIHTETYQKFFA